MALHSMKRSSWHSEVPQGKKIVNVYLWLDHLFAKHYDRIGNNLNLLLKKIRNKHFPVKYLKYTLLQKKSLMQAI